MDSLILYARESLKPALDMVPLGWMHRCRGRVAHALLTLVDHGFFFVQLLIKRSGHKDEEHAVVYAAHLHGGAILDNDWRCDVICVTPEDRLSPFASYMVWDALFPVADEVKVLNAWHMVIM